MENLKAKFKVQTPEMVLKRALFSSYFWEQIFEVKIFVSIFSIVNFVRQDLHVEEARKRAKFESWKEKKSNFFNRSDIF